MSYSFWMLQTFPNNVSYSYAGIKTTGGANGWDVINNSKYFFRFDVHCSTTGSSYPINPIGLNKWHHVVVTWDGTACPFSASDVAIYVDGVLQTTTGITAGSGTRGSDSAAPLSIGCNDPAGNSCLASGFPGYLDDVRIYNRALSASEIAHLYREGVGTHQNTTITPPSLSTGLVGHWTFDGKDMINSVADTSGQGNNGDLVSYTSTTTTPGVLGQALTFSSALGQNVEILSRNGFSTGSGSKWSFSAWVKPATADLDSSYHMLVSYGQVGTGELPDIDINSGGHWSMSCYGGYSIADSATVKTGVWTHVVGTYDGTNMRLYLNGGLAVGPTAESGCAPTNANAAIGAQAGTGSFSFDGALDDVRIYDRALSASEVMHLYKLGR